MKKKILKEELTKSDLEVIRKLIRKELSSVYFDLYRLKSINEFIEIGGLEYLDNQMSISLIEWPDLINDIAIKNMINIKFEYLSEKERLITVLS